MKLARFLFKPRWQSKDAAVRRNAVAAEHHDELRQTLPLLARTDPDPGVRLAALKRLADPGIAQALAHDDADPGVRSAAHTIWLDLLSGSHAQAPALDERLRLLRAQSDPALIEHLALHATDAGLRSAALERVERASLIADRAMRDPDPVLRLAAVERVGDEAQLTRIIERVRKSDKALARRARERLDALRIARGDMATVIELARALCEQLEQLTRKPDDVARIEADVVERWSAVAEVAPAELVMRYTSARQLLHDTRDPVALLQRRERAAALDVIESELDDLERAMSRDDALRSCDEFAQRLTALAEQHDGAHDERLATRREAVEERLARLTSQLGALQAEAEAAAASEPILEETIDPEVLAAQARFAASVSAAKAENERERERQQALLGQVQGKLDALERALDSGISADAHAAHASLAVLRKQLSAGLPRSAAAQVAELEGRYAQIARWQRWGDDQRRQQLCEEIEALPAAALHPDAVATRVREAQAEWMRLETVEGRRGAGGDGLSRRFRAACRQAMEPVKPYFDKRRELRQGHRQEIDALLQRIGTPAESELGVRDLTTLRREAAEALRSLDNVDPRERNDMARRIKDTLAAIDARVNQIHAQAEEAKDALIAAAGQLSASDKRAAIAGVRDLQQRWKLAGNGRRNRDQAQWNTFRAAIDAVFAAMDAERAALDAQAGALHEQAQAVCAELEALLAAGDEAERGARSRIEAAWETLAIGDETLRARFRAAQAALGDAATQRARAQRRGRFDAWLARYQHCRANERSGAVAADPAVWEALPSTDIASDELQARHGATAQGERMDAGSADDFRNLLLELEYLAGVDSPDEDKQRRLDLQVGKLAARLRGEETTDSPAQLAALLSGWTALGALPDGCDGYDARLENAIAAVLETLG